jgi:hypothetical protein
MSDETEKILSVCYIAKKLQIDESSFRRMFHNGILKGILTGASGWTIRIFKSSFLQHISGNTRNTGVIWGGCFGNQRCANGDRAPNDFFAHLNSPGLAIIFNYEKKIVLPKNGRQLLASLCETYNIVDGAGLILAQQAAEALDTALQAEKLIKKHGMVVVGERGLRANPACNIARDSRNRLLIALGKLNLEL